MNRTKRTAKRVRPAGGRRVKRQSYNWGFNSGFNIGYTKGHELGLEKGAWAIAHPFEGTSIVIPTYNQHRYLKECIESIEQFTPEPHEIIVVDNGSTDGTAEYLQSLKPGTVRFKICPENLGFAGGVNQGLMMARGTSLMFLNNDTIVTQHWLSNLLACMRACGSYGLIGPLTNYISGDQLIETSYKSIEEMHRFAATINRSSPEKWRATGRLTGFCVLMTRETFRRLGYLDEGFEIGNCEDDDYGFRTRLLGLELIIAHDTFIHHVGSTTIKTLTPEQFEEMYGRNLAFYSSKWGETHILLQETHARWDGEATRTIDLYPSHVVVQGAGEARYWIEGGRRFPLRADVDAPSTRISQIDVRNWPVGETLSQAQLQEKLAAVAPSEHGELPDGALARTKDGYLYQRKGQKLHRIATEWAAEAWRLKDRPVRMLSREEKASYPEGMPIIAPPILKAAHL
ncbi:glycosyltransferase family 2 protein [Paenibacillus koleovorans]|uniref:glycosyltransferase family 2 protein n=1 Tax=Paenibacillus koleovorans TaxID=121608 RepID=UPI000FD6CFE1|nr:glycosyltransferase family 2 protein [Paenibacillus koleovorans]